MARGEGWLALPARVTRRAVATALAVAASTGIAVAHGGSLRGATPERLAVPTWLFLLTGGGVIAASFLLTSFVTDRGFVARVHDRRSVLPAPRSALAWSARAVGVAVLAVVVYAGFRGPAKPLRNAAILVVWVGWWAGLAMAAYLVGNAWPMLNPWRVAADLRPGSRRLPERLGAWPAAVALLALVWFEVVSPLADDAQLLAAAIVAYSAVTVAGAVVYGDAWFERVDPVSRVFRTYGGVAPVQRTEEGIALRLPGSALIDDALRDGGAVAFVVALLWGTTYDGLVATPAWAAFARTVVGAGVPAAALYPATLALGFGAFLAVFHAAARAARRTGPTYLAASDLARRFAPALVPIAAGYHLAHYLDYLLALAPALGATLASPLAPPLDPPVLVLPGWVGGVAVAAVIGGHLLAVWIAHAVAYDALPGRLQAVRSQYALTLAMVAYTMISLWVVSQPTVTPPYL
jgi:hypothetical protein